MKKLKPYTMVIALYLTALLNIVHPGFKIHPVVQTILVSASLLLGTLLYTEIVRFEMAFERYANAALSHIENGQADAGSGS